MLEAMDFGDFLIECLPPPPVRLLEVGCGSGELARRLSRTGYEILAIDPEAPPGKIFLRVALEDFTADESFGAVIANRSLHHIADLSAAVDRIKELLQPGAAFILNEFAWDRMNEETAAWYVSHASVPDHEHESLLPGNFPTAWIAEHEGLHGFEAMLHALESRFLQEHFEWFPYVARYYLERLDLEPEETRLIDSGRIRAIGFRYVGRPTQ